MRIGIYGGTFNPPHLGHMSAASAAVAALGLDRLLMVPAGLPPHKTMAEETPAPEHRLAMARLAADALRLEKVGVSAMELAREGPSYTADTLRQVRAVETDAELWLIMGADMFLTLHRWRDAQLFLPGLHVAAFARTQSETGELLTIQGEYLSKTYGAVVRIIELPELVDISSSRLRELLGQGVGAQYLAPGVYGYVLREGLYGVAADLKNLTNEQLRAVAASLMRAKRIAHVLGTEEEAARLAKRWGADVFRARRAAILHDCTKYCTMDEQLNLCQKYDIVLDDLERGTLKLLHAPTGAALAREVFGADEEIYGAIRWHTTGRANMTPLEKVLYLADYIEPNRDFDGVERLRALACEDLDAALLAGLELTVQDMGEYNLPVHRHTLEAIAYLKGHAL